MHLARPFVIGLLAGFALCACAVYTDGDEAPPSDDTQSVEQAAKPANPCDTTTCDVGFHCVAHGRKAECVMDKRPKAN